MRVKTIFLLRSSPIFPREDHLGFYRITDKEEQKKRAEEILDAIRSKTGSSIQFTEKRLIRKEKDFAKIKLDAFWFWRCVMSAVFSDKSGQERHPHDHIKYARRHANHIWVSLPF